MTHEQLEAVYYAWCRSQAILDAVGQLYNPIPLKDYHDMVAEPYSKFLFVWIGLTHTVVGRLYELNEIPPSIAEECRMLHEPWSKFCNAVFHIKNHPLSEEYDALFKIPKFIERVLNVHHVCGQYLCHQLDLPYPPFVGTPAQLIVPVLLPKKPT
jgi:hypothetical protein